MREGLIICISAACCLQCSAVGCSSDSATSGTNQAPTGDAATIDSAQIIERSDVALLDHTAWQTYPAAADPLPSHQPEMIDCGPAGWYIEKNYFAHPLLEVDTNYCNYVLLEHPSLVDVAAGDSVTFELRHYDLDAPEPAVGHVAIFFGDDLQWQTEIPIPGMADALSYTWTATRALTRDEPIRLHLHNHGQNTWLVAGLHALVAQPAP